MFDKGDNRSKKIKGVNAATFRIFKKKEDYFIKTLDAFDALDPTKQWLYLINYFRNNYEQKDIDIALQKIGKNAKKRFLRRKIIPIPFRNIIEENAKENLKLPQRRRRRRRGPRVLVT